MADLSRRNLLLVSGLGALAATVPLPVEWPKFASYFRTSTRPLPAGPVAVPSTAPVDVDSPFLFHDEFDGAAGSGPDPAKWVIATAREVIKEPKFWDRPENMGQYRDDRRNIFLDGNSNLVIRATAENGHYFGGKLAGKWAGGIGLTWEARVKFECLMPGCWPAWWLLNDDPVQGGEVDLVEWYGNGIWPSGSTVHARLDGTSFATQPFEVDSEWHIWRVTWNEDGVFFWRDYADGAEPYFAVSADSLDDWPFNDPGFRLSPMLNLAVAGAGGGDPSGSIFPADMLVDWIRIW
ncbi:glycoside hydrolase family 16 protein [Mycobacterium sp. NPDC006124]|uniref:glycoside hydrolase family 16 protein n=1 Tax=Mycobacterium sp. NPDC006124 TaxID=3156729 RepID=UPI0033A88FF2